MLAILVITHVVAPRCFVTATVRRFPDREVNHEAVGARAVPVLDVRCGVNRFARAKCGDLTSAFLHESGSFDDVQVLAKGM